MRVQSLFDIGPTCLSFKCEEDEMAFSILPPVHYLKLTTLVGGLQLHSVICSLEFWEAGVITDFVASPATS